jgi:hypothetical protein
MMGINNVHVKTSLGEIKTIDNVLYVLGLRKSLLSIDQLQIEVTMLFLTIKNASSTISTFIRR